MLTLYYAAPACSTASFIALEETGAAYEARPVDLGKGEHKSEAFLKINPLGTVPALTEDGLALNENVAILCYVAKRFPAAQLLPADLPGEARCLSFIAWCSSSAHIARRQARFPGRFTTEQAAKPAISALGREKFQACLASIDNRLAGNEWVMGEQYTVCDPYALLFYLWGTEDDYPMPALRHYTAFKDRMLQRPAVQKVLEKIGSPLVR